MKLKNNSFTKTLIFIFIYKKNFLQKKIIIYLQKFYKNLQKKIYEIEVGYCR